MKITGVRIVGADVRRVSINLPHLTLIEVMTDEGLVGIGATWFSQHKVAPLLLEGKDSIEQAILGEDPLTAQRIWRQLYETKWIEGALAIGAMGAIDMALWDIIGKAQGLPLHTLLGGAVQPRIMAYASSSAFYSSSYEGPGPWRIKSAEDLAEESRDYVRQGFKALKYGWANHFRPEDEERLAAIREAIGPNIKLMIDFGNPAYLSPGWNVGAAIRAARMLEKYDVYFFEEPMLPYDVEGHAAVAQAVDINIATGESLCAFHEFEQFIERGAVDILQPDAMQMGVTQLHRIAQRAEEAGLLCIPHSPWSVFAVMCHLQVLATVRNGPLIEYPAFASFEEGSRLAQTTYASHYQIVETPPVLRDGYLELPTGPGLGLGQFVLEGVAGLQAVYDGEDRR
jgi:D-galactarolactone cycloisomerase